MKLISKEKAAEWLPITFVLVYIFSVVTIAGKMLLGGIAGIITLPFYLFASIIGLLFTLVIAHFLGKRRRVAYCLAGLFTVIGLLIGITTGALLKILLDLFLLYLIYKSREVYL